ncbi:hypothetical protein GCM10011391_25930 [Pullulanibacillus camelliae]|uniref:Uncharacterized protein n=1 Tax=Pullulanibacillus camelliae TaxID=1707096 RepID=A0A8J2YJB1_9BACL|nr:hypothetical protein [Pullulanibacillus camelliae]GGE45906.1 hypothetical protein GCM10011391_25930 [Pullulanibacillus camelliae]
MKALKFSLLTLALTATVAMSAFFYHEGSSKQASRLGGYPSAGFIYFNNL